MSDLSLGQGGELADLSLISRTLKTIADCVRGELTKTVPSPYVRSSVPGAAKPCSGGRWQSVQRRAMRIVRCLSRGPRKVMSDC